MSQTNRFTSAPQNAIWWPLLVLYSIFSRDSQTRKIQENITNVEKHFGEMCQMFAAYVRKTARLRDKADVLVREIGTYADTETPNLKRGMKQFADYLAKIEDYRQAEVKLQYLISCCFSNKFVFIVKMCIVIVNKGKIGLQHCTITAHSS